LLGVVFFFELKIYYEICKKSSRAPKKSFAGTSVPAGIRLAITGLDLRHANTTENYLPEILPLPAANRTRMTHDLVRAVSNTSAHISLQVLRLHKNRRSVTVRDTMLGCVRTSDTKHGTASIDLSSIRTPLLIFKIECKQTKDTVW
jgi:hypothetical protein